MDVFLDHQPMYLGTYLQWEHPWFFHTQNQTRDFQRRFYCSTVEPIPTSTSQTPPSLHRLDRAQRRNEFPAPTHRICGRFKRNEYLKGWWTVLGVWCVDWGSWSVDGIASTSEKGRLVFTPFLKKSKPHNYELQDTRNTTQHTTQQNRHTRATWQSQKHHSKPFHIDTNLTSSLGPLITSSGKTYL